MKNNSTVAMPRKRNVSAKKLTIGMDPGDRFSYYCVLDEAGEVLIEQKLPTAKTAMQQAFGRIPCSRVALANFPSSKLLRPSALARLEKTQ